jgi:hypothetical protein
MCRTKKLLFSVFLLYWHFRERTCTFSLFICFAIYMDYYCLPFEIVPLGDVPLCDNIDLSWLRLVRLTSIDASMWYWDGNSQYRKITFPKCSAPVCSCILLTLSKNGKKNLDFFCFVTSFHRILRNYDAMTS